MADEKPRLNALSMIAAGMPSRRQKLKIWAIRSVIVIAAAYGIVSLNGPAWLIWLAWAYVALTLVLAFVMTRGQSAGKAD
jgi:fatty acid desaturase